MIIRGFRAARRGENAAARAENGALRRARDKTPVTAGHVGEDAGRGKPRRDAGTRPGRYF